MGRLTIICLLAAAQICCGCTTITGGPADTPVPTASPTATPDPVTTVATPTPTPDPYPDALAVGEVFSYGGEEDGRELSIYRYRVLDSYQIHHPDWGYNYGTVTPAPGKKFLFIFVRIEHNGTKKELGAPHPGSINVLFDGKTISYRTDRVGTVTTVMDFSGDEDYYGGIIHIYEKREGFLIYEVPESFDPARGYAAVNVGNGIIPVWRLG
jgi:hypothetical protein